MGIIVEENVWHDAIYALDTSTPVKGGQPIFDTNGNPTDGFANASVKQLADRTKNLKERIDNIPVIGTPHRKVFVAGTDFIPGATQIDLTDAPTTKDSLLVFFDAAMQQSTEYSLSGSLIVFEEPIPEAVEQVEVLFSVLSPLTSDEVENVVHSISDLRLRSGVEGESIDVLGYYSPGDGGGGSFYFDSTSTEADNGGTVINANGNTGPGRWKRNIVDAISVKQFGSPADGSDDTPYWQAAIDWIDPIVGGRIRVTGPATYRINGTVLVQNKNNIHIDIDDTATIDTSGSSTGDAFRFFGSVGNEILTATNLERGSTVITTTVPHGLVVGDWFLIMSQRACLHEDAGEWRLGDITTGTTMPFFAEPCQVKSVESSTQLTITTGLIFPSYRVDRTQETFSSTRVSTIRKINFISGSKVTGGKFIVRGGGSGNYPNNPRCAIRTMWAYEPEIRVPEFDLGSLSGFAVLAVSSMRPTIKAKSTRPSNWEKGSVDHSQFNGFKDISSWYANWDVEELNGSQGLDITFASGVTPYFPSIMPVITGSSYNSKETGMTFHPGAYGGTVVNFRAINCPNTGIFVRSPYVTIINPYISNNGNVAGSSSGILSNGWGIGMSIIGGFVEGYLMGIRRTRDGDVAAGPVNARMLVDGTTIVRCGQGFRGSKSVFSEKTNERCGIQLSNIRMTDIVDYGVFLDDYYNNIEISGLSVERLLGTNPSCIRFSNNSVGASIERVTGKDLGSNGVIIYRSGTMTDTETFPVATYKTPDLRIDWPSFKLFGTGKMALLSSAWFYRPGSNFTLALDDMTNPIWVNSTSGISITIPPSSVLDFPPGGSITLYQEATGAATFVPGTGVTIVSRNGGLKTAGQGSCVVLTKRSGDTWYLSGDTTA